MLKVTEFAFTGYSVTDMKRARVFYEKVLNLPVASVFGEDKENPDWVEYEVGPHVLALCVGGEMWKPSKDGGGVALEVEDFDASVQWLRDHNVNIYFGPFESPVCHMVLLSDPDGNSVCIHKRKPGHG